MIKKNFNRRNSHSHHGSKRHELLQHTHSSGSYAFTVHTLIINIVTTTLCEASAQLYYRIWNQMFVLKIPKGIAQYQH